MKGTYDVYKEQILARGLDEKETNKIINMLNNETDHRSINKAFLDALCKVDGPIHEFLVKVCEINKNVKYEEKLIICFRRNKITIYKNNHILWDISRTKDRKYAIEINFDHARYCTDWKNMLDELRSDKYGFEVALSDKEREKVVDPESGMRPVCRENSDEVTGGSIGNIRVKKDYYTKEFVDGTYKIFNKLITDFMKEGKDQFRIKMQELANDSKKDINMAEDICDRGSTPYIEKRWQQRLFHYFKDKKEETPWIFAYDLEFSQRYPNEDIKKKLEANEPDMMAIQFDDEGNAEKLLFIEVKSKYSACWSLKTDKETNEKIHKSDLWSHVKGMKSYCDMPYFIRSRIVDAYQILKQYYDLKLYPELKMESIESVLCLTENDIERVILLTNDNYIGKKSTRKTSAIDFINKEKPHNNPSNKEKLKKLIDEEDPQCKIWITNSNYFDENLIFDFNYSL